MASASYAVTSFLGGEISQFAQGDFTKPSYRISLNVCLNWIPVEIGPLGRRPGSAFAGATKGGKPGRVISWAFQQAAPITLEYTDGNLCFRHGTTWLTDNNAQEVVSISGANPAVVTVSAGIANGQRVILSGLGTTCPLLQNRQFTWVHTGSTTGTLTDALTGAAISGVGLGTPAAGTTIASIQDVSTPYIAGAWSEATMRMVQAETTGILLNGAIAPQAMTVTQLPAGAIDAEFALAAATFEDGPYLDPFTNGVQAVPNGTTGIVQLTLQFPAYVATTSYATGDFVTSSSVNYESLVDQNIGNTPASSPSEWAPVDASAAINPPPNQPNGAGRGFLGTDIGRLVRLFSEPQLWNVTSSYALGAVVSYNPTGQPGAATYWQSTIPSNSGNVPGGGEVVVSGTLTNVWELVAPGAALPSIGTFTNPAGGSGPAQWTYGRIVSLLNFISGSVSGVAQVGTMTAGGGLAAAFDGSTNQNGASSAGLSTTVSVNVGNNYPLNSTVGQNFSGTSATAYAIDHATIFPASDLGFAELFPQTQNVSGTLTTTFFLYGSPNPPGSAGFTQLGSTSIQVSGTFPKAVVSVLGAAPLTIVSSNKTTTFAYVWIAQQTNFNMNGGNPTVLNLYNYIAQVQFFAGTTSASTSAGCNVELLGPPLLYSAPIMTWRLGAYSNTTGYPTCGCYADGRLWLGGAIPNRFDACYSNGIVGSAVNFAPTDQYGTVTEAHAISYTLNNDSVNPLLWMIPDLQGIILGTQQKEILLFAPSQGGLSPLNIDERPAGRHGAANVQPVATEHTYIFVQRYAIKLMEYFADIFSGKFTAPNLADKAQHITRNGIAEIAYTYAATPLIWGRDTANNLFGITYKRDTLMTSQGPTYYAWHRQALGSGRVVESLCAGPSTGGNLDALTMVTNATAATDPQANIRHVEVLTDVLDELATLPQSWYLDDAVNPTSVASSSTAQTGAPYGGLTLNGLWHLNGENIAIFVAGLDCGNATVGSGSVFVPYGDGISGGTAGGLFTAAFAAAAPLTQIVVGFTYNSDGQLVRPQAPADVGTRTGPALGKRRRFHKVAALFVNLAMGNVRNQSALSIGRDFNNLKPVIVGPETVPNLPRLSPGQTFSGVWKDTVQAESGYDGMVAFRVSRPLPCNIAAMEPLLHGEDD
jgi:hypothetical protein